MPAFPKNWVQPMFFGHSRKIEMIVMYTVIDVPAMVRERLKQNLATVALVVLAICFI